MKLDLRNCNIAITMFSLTLKYFRPLKRGAKMSGSNPDPGDVFRSRRVCTGNSPWRSCSFALSPRSAFIPFSPSPRSLRPSLPFACPYRALLCSSPLATLLLLPVLLFLRFSSGGLYERVKYIPRTCNYANTDYRMVSRSVASARKRGPAVSERRCCVRVASYSTVDEIRRSTGYHRINLQLETQKALGDRLYNPQTSTYTL